MAKKDKKKTEDNPELQDVNEKEEGNGSKIITILIVTVIVLIWAAVFGVLIKLNIGNFGSDVLYPVLKDVPILNRILPDVDENYSGQYDYNSVAEAVTRIKELEKQLAASQDTNEADKTQLTSLQTEVDRLKKFEADQEAFAKRVEDFDNNVVFNEKAPDIAEYRTFYEGIEPDNASKIYQKVVEELQYSQKIKNMADIYSKMEPAQAAAVFETMTGDLDLLAGILDSMSQSASAEILQNMTSESAAQITKKITKRTTSN